MKFLIIPIAIFGLLGIGAIAAVDIANDDGGFLPEWGGRGGGCQGGGGRYLSSAGDDHDPPCHGSDGDRESEEYCSYHDDYFTEAEWEEHRDECPYYDEN